MTPRELKFRKKLIDTMGGRWYPAIHVENHLNPGVPDLSYVMVANGHETGWLELKSVSVAAALAIKVEQSQHMWMDKVAGRVPCHFAIEVGTDVYIVNGTDHSRVHTGMAPMELESLAIRRFHAPLIASELSAFFRTLTKRDRHGHQ